MKYFKLSRNFFILSLTFFSFLDSSLAQSADSLNLGQSLMNLISQFQNTEPFQIFGEDKLWLKFMMSEALKNHSVKNQVLDIQSLDIQKIKEKYLVFKQNVSIVKKDFSSMEDYIDFEKTEWPQSGDLKTDIKRIEEVGLTLTVPHFDNEIANQLWAKNEQNQIQFLKKMGLATITSLVNLSQSEFRSNQSEGFYGSSVQRQIENQFVELFRGMFSRNGDQLMRDVLPILLSEYFKNSSSEMKVNIFSALLDLKFPLSKEDLISTFFANSGPQLQKVIQLLARNKSISPEWKKLFKKFESNGRPVPDWQVQKLLAGSTFPFEILEFEKEPLGVGTMAQVHGGKVKFPDGKIKQVVFRFIKPGIQVMALAETLVINNACEAIDKNPDFNGKDYPKFSKLASNAYSMILDDMNLKVSAKNQLEGIAVYSRSDVFVPEVWLSLEEQPLFMVQTRADGEELSNHSIQVRQNALNTFIQYWLEEALFGTGFFHADPHPGNLMVKLREKFKGADRELKTLLDFGMVGRLSKEDRLNLMGFAVAIAAKNIQSLTEMAWRMSDTQQNSITRNELYQKIDEKYGVRSDHEISNDPHFIDSILKFFPQIGLELNLHIQEFLRGSVELSSQLAEVDTKNTFLSNAIKVVSRHPIQALKVLKLKEVTTKDLFKVAWNQIFKKKKSTNPSLVQKTLIKPLSSDSSAQSNQCLKHYGN